MRWGRWERGSGLGELAGRSLGHSASCSQADPALPSPGVPGESGISHLTGLGKHGVWYSRQRLCMVGRSVLCTSTVAL